MVPLYKSLVVLLLALAANILQNPQWFQELTFFLIPFFVKVWNGQIWNVYVFLILHHFIGNGQNPMQFWNSSFYSFMTIHFRNGANF